MNPEQQLVWRIMLYSYPKRISTIVKIKYLRHMT